MTFQSEFKMKNKYHIGWKTFWEKEKLLVTMNFSLSHNVFHSYISYVCHNAAFCGNGLNQKTYLNNVVRFTMDYNPKYRYCQFGPKKLVGWLYWG